MKLTRTIELTLEKNERIVVHRRRTVSLSRDRVGDKAKADESSTLLSEPRKTAQNKLVEPPSEEQL